MSKSLQMKWSKKDNNITSSSSSSSSFRLQNSQQDSQEENDTIFDNKQLYKQFKAMYYTKDMNGIIKRYESMKVKNMKISNPTLVSIIISAYLKAQQYEKVDEILNPGSQIKYSLDDISYATVIKYHLTNNTYDKAFDVYEIMKRSSVSINSVHTGGIILDMLMQRRDYSEVTAVIKELSEKKLFDIISYCTLMKGYMKVGKYDKAREVYEYMKRSGVCIYGAQAGNIVLDMLMCLQDYTEVTSVMKELTEKKLLNAVTYSTLMKGYMKVGKYENAREVYEAMKQSDVSIDETQAFSIILDMLMQLRDYTEVTAVIKELTEKKLLDIISYCTLMKGYMKVGKYDKAREVYEAMKQSGVSLDGAQAASIILDMLMHLEDYKEVTSVMKELAEKKLLDVVIFTTLIKGYMKVESYNEALKVCNMMKRSNITFYNTMTGNIILDLLMRQQEYKEVSVIVKELSARKLIDIVTYSTLIKGYMKANRYEEAREIYDCMKKSNIVMNKSQAVGIMIDLLVRCKDFTEAELLLQTLIDNKVANCSSYTTLMKGYMRDNKYPSAQHVYDKMKQAKMCIDTNISGTIILDLLLKTHNTQEAISVFKDMSDKKLVDDSTLNTMKAGLKCCGNTDDIEDMNTILASYKLQEKEQKKKNENGDKTKRWKKVT